MPWGALIVAGGTYLASREANKGAGKAADAQAEANALGIAEQRRQFDLTRQDMMPWLTSGRGALGRLDAASNGDMSGFQQSPDYNFRFDQGMQGLDRSAAAKGSLFSGGADADRIAFGQGLASAEYGNWWNRQAGLAGVGQTTASQLGSLGAGMSSNIGNLLNNTGQARASAYQTAGDNNAKMWGGVAGAFNQAGQNKGWWGG